MKFVDEFRSEPLAHRLAAQIAELAGNQPYQIMEVCGGAYSYTSTDLKITCPFCTTLVSPVTIWMLAACAADFIEVRMRLRSAIGNPSSRMSPADRWSGPARSFTVPLTATSPIFPPGKNNGETTNGR